MTKEQFLVYLWSIYPTGGFTLFYIIFLVIFLFILGLLYINYSDDMNSKSDDKLREYGWRKLGKLKLIIPLFFIFLLFVSKLVPSRDNFLLIIATPYIVDSGKNMLESLSDPTSKAYKINELTNKSLDIAIKKLDKITGEEDAKNK